MAQDFFLRLITQRAAGGAPIVRERRVKGPQLNIGRSAENDIVLADLSVDPRHARLRLTGPGRALVESVGGLPFQSGGKDLQRIELDVAAQPELTFGEYQLKLEPGDDGDVVVIVTREEADHVPSPSVFSLRASLFSRRRLAWTFGVGILLVALLIPVFASGLFRGEKIRPDQQWSTGPLAEAHAFLEADCNACHQKAFVAVRDTACMSCHEQKHPLQQANFDADLQQRGSPFSPVAVPEHGTEGLPADELHDRLRKGTPPTGGWMGRVQSAFNHPTDRCASCHIEHTKATGPQGTAAPTAPRQAKPTLVVVNTCESCHTQLKMRLSDTKLIDTPDWGKHPKFRPQVTQDARDNAVAPRLWLTSNPREANGLIFPHDLHVDPLGGPARQAIGLGRTKPGASPVTCTSCHAREGTDFKPVNMERDCEACHSLAFAQGPNGLAKLPHEEPEKVLAYLNQFYGGGGQGAGVMRAAFTGNGACVACHTITWKGSMPVVARVHLSQDFMPRSDFNHMIEQHGGKSADELVCRDCHRSPALRANPAATRAQPWRISSNAADLMMPDKAQCDTCHGNEKARKADSAPADCKTCHSFHDPGLATCDPQDRPLEIRTWPKVASAPKCGVKPRRFATAQAPAS